MKSLIIITLILGCSALMAVMFGAWWHLFTAAAMFLLSYVGKKQYELDKKFEERN